MDTREAAEGAAAALQAAGFSPPVPPTPPAKAAKPKKTKAEAAEREHVVMTTSRMLGPHGRQIPRGTVVAVTAQRAAKWAKQKKARPAHEAEVKGAAAAKKIVEF